MPAEIDSSAEKAAARAAFDRVEGDLVELSHRIHAHPEIKWEEEQACAWLGESLTGYGFDVESGICDLPTAFQATVGSGPLHVVVCAEYDALPGIGHACGHNIIAATAVGAGVALAEVADDLGLTVRVMGTPAEEGGGGKILLLKGGAFDGAHLAMMTHPAPIDIAEWPIIAAQQFRIRYTGKEAHASAFPELGRNAADALTVAGVAIGLLRQHLHTGDRVHGIVTHGGDAPNIVPAHTEAEYIIRGATVADFEIMRERVMRCFEAGALATGTSLEVMPRHEPYAEMHHDPVMAAAYRSNAEALGRTFPSFNLRAAGSTDMGNVSLAIPSIHPAIGIDSRPAVNHQPEFAAHCITPAADQALRDGAVAMAWTAIDCATDAAVRTRLLAKA
ncbi:MAG TPA: M20 family metallopeptidase [Acidimicrobiia bacterium]|nr:M20 family metallopeptidase [Acidimicrobiia bacterium]